MTVEVTSQARQRLFEIWQRIARESSSTIADKVEERLLKRARELKAHPRKGPEEPALEFRRQGHRFLLLGRYKILYLITEERSSISSQKKWYSSLTFSIPNSILPACAGSRYICLSVRRSSHFKILRPSDP